MEQEDFKKTYADVKNICTRRKALAIIDFVYNNGIGVGFIHPLSLRGSDGARVVSNRHSLYMDTSLTDEQIDEIYKLVVEVNKTPATKNIKAIRVYVTIFFWLVVLSALGLAAFLL